MSFEGLQLGQYRLQRLLGSGGMGEVYLAEDPRISQQVAIKVSRTEVSPYPNSASAQEAMRLFQREAKAIARLDHPHILPLFSYGEENLNGVTCTYIVMPFRSEGSLNDWLRARSAQILLSPQEVAAFIVQAADALQYAHEHQIIHQDVKPSNFLIRSRKGYPNQPDLLLADFGIARLSSSTSSMSHSVRGTPTYMAPEQWSGDPLPATDQYALAVMAYELLTGRTPFTGRQEQVMYQHLQVVPQPPSSLNAQIPAASDQVVLRALAKQPADRFPAIDEFAQALQQTVHPAPTLPAPPPPVPAEIVIRATLAISQMEAWQGTTRTLTLPGGRKMAVTVPQGASDGQILYPNGRNADSQGEILILTIAVTQPAEAQLPVNPASDAPTARASNSNGLEATVSATSPESKPNGVAPTVYAASPSSHEQAPTVAASNSVYQNPTVLAQNAGALPTSDKRVVASGGSEKKGSIGSINKQWIVATLKDKSLWSINKQQIVAMAIGTFIFGILYYALEKLVMANVHLIHYYTTDGYDFSYYSYSNLLQAIGGSPYLPSPIDCLVGCTTAVVLFFGVKYGPWVGLVAAVIGGLCGDYLSGYIAWAGFVGYAYLDLAIFGFIPGFAFRKTWGHYSTRGAMKTAVVVSTIALLIGSISGAIGESHGIGGGFLRGLSARLLLHVFSLILLPVLLIISERIAKRRRAA